MTWIPLHCRCPNLVWEQQTRSPTFTGLAVPSNAELRADWMETLADPQTVFFVAERDGRAVGDALLYPAPEDLGTPADAICLATMGTVPDVRGTGVGLALTMRVLTWALAAGYPTVVTDWRVANLLASRFWPARGFRPTFHRLHRVLESG